MKRLLCMLLFAATLLLSACGGSQTQDTTVRDPDTIVVAMGTGSEPASGFDPAYGWGAGEHVHEPLIQSTLTVTTQELDIAYDLATSLTVSEDGLTWTAVIRDDVKFTDGEALTAGDVAFTYNTVKELSTVNDFTMLDHAEATDDTTVVFHLNTPYSIWPYSMANVGIVPQHAYGPDYGQAPIGSGRYILKQWDKGQQVILEANPDYYGEAPKVQNVVILFMSEDAAFAAAKAGQVDVAYTAASYAVQSIDGYSILSAESVDNRGLNLPAVPANGTVGNDVTADRVIRQAINIGIDRQALIDHVLMGYGTPAYSVCDKMPWYSGNNEVAYDLEAARTMLDEAGWTEGADGIREKNGVRAELNLLYPSSDSVRQAIAAEVSNQLKSLGISASFEGVGWDTAYDRAFSEPLIWGWGAHTPMEVYNIYHTAPGSDHAVYSPYRSAEADALMDRALAERDNAAAMELWQQAQDTVSEDMPWIWLCNIDHLYWVRDGLQVAEQKIHPHGHGWSIVNNIDQWSWSES